MAKPSDFIDQYGDLALALSQRVGVAPEVLLGQFGLETGWGKSVIPGTNNLGNIKDFSGGGTSAVDNMLGTTDRYRNFDSPEAFADHYAGLLERKYPNAIGTGADALAFAQALKEGGYAEDPNYVNKIAQVTQTVRNQPNFMERIANAVIPSAQAASVPANPTPWRQVMESEQFKSLSPEQQLLAQQQYFDQVVAPRIPEGAMEQARSQFFGQYSLAPANPAIPTPIDQTAQQSQPTASPEGGGVGGGFMMGLRDPIDAGAQMLRRAVPEGVGRAVDDFGNLLADIGVPIARSTGVEGVDQIVNQANQEYEAARAASGREGIDWARIGGNVAGTIPAALAAPAGGASLLGRAAAGAGAGAIVGSLNPIVGEQAQENFQGEKLQQALLGGAFGAIAPVVTSGIGRIISPAASRADSPAQTLLREGVELTPGQAMGGAAMRVEDRLMSAPILGDAIRGARNRGQESLNKAVYNRVLQPIGGQTKKIGREAIDDISSQIGKAYDDVLGKVNFRLDAEFGREFGQLQKLSQSLPPQQATQFSNIVQNQVGSRLTRQGGATGQNFKAIESEIGRLASTYRGSADAGQRELGTALQELQFMLRRNLERVNPDQAGQLSKINEAYANFVRLQNAGSRIGAQEGVFTPSQLASAVRQTDRSLRKGNYARGQALMQDLSDAAQSRMASKIPDSGTAERLMINAGAIGSGAYNPAIPIGLGAASIPYLPGLNRVATGLVTSRPQAAQNLAEALQKLPAGLAGLLAQ